MHAWARSRACMHGHGGVERVWGGMELRNPGEMMARNDDKVAVAVRKADDAVERGPQIVANAAELLVLALGLPNQVRYVGLAHNDLRPHDVGLQLPPPGEAPQPKTGVPAPTLVVQRVE